ncbi:MAG TPA: MTH1187 family thiamine-binding protein [Tepidisphaeraceae bacterium]|nr:MTH1187 family thiamine-binding protein [Tepidisphaeraceae bacterium]
MLLAEFSIWPMDKGESVGKYVAKALDIVDRSGLPYKLGPLGTCIEGEWPEVMAVIQKCYESLATDSSRVSCTIKCDWRRGHSGRLNSKVDSVEKSLGRKLKT